MMQQSSSANCLQATDEAKAFMMRYTPDAQRQMCVDEKDCYFGHYPTLAEVNATYGLNVSQAWLIPQIVNLATFCGCREKLDKQQQKDLAFVLATQYYYLKISEFMLFFHRFKAGHYGRFYGNIDPLVITTSLITFIKERNSEIDREEQRKRQASQTTPEQRQKAYEEWAHVNGLDPESVETQSRYSDMLFNQ